MFGGRPAMDPRTALYDAYLAPQQQRYAQEHMLGVNLEHGFPGSYGVALPSDMKPPMAHGRGVRRQLNAAAILLAVAVPFGLFVLTFCIMSFGLYYQYPSTAVMALLIACFAVLVMGAVSTQAKRTEIVHGERTWHQFIFLTACFAFIVGTLLGYLNLESNSYRYFDYISLRKAVGVEPGTWQGQQLLDAGEVNFKAKAHLNLNLSASWHKGKTYCVAPIVSADGTKMVNYDFWAVGMDCCSTRPGDFSCGETYPLWKTSMEEPAGLRVMDQSEIEGYKLAVEQASAAHNLQSLRPIFLYMMKSPYSKIKSYYTEAKECAIWCFALYFVMQCVLVGSQAYKFGQGMPSGYLDLNEGRKGKLPW